MKTGAEKMLVNASSLFANVRTFTYEIDDGEVVG